MERCSGITQRGSQCCKRTKNSYDCYGVFMPLCGYHKETNPILNWSRTYDYSVGPEIVVKWLDFYNDIVEKSDIPKWLSVYITSRLYGQIPSDLSSYDLIRIFMNSVLLPCDQVECPICMSNEEEEYVTTPCGHSFCRKCLVKWMYKKVQCPLCRKIIC
jgi:hypothetical protein